MMQALVSNRLATWRRERASVALQVWASLVGLSFDNVSLRMYCSADGFVVVRLIYLQATGAIGWLLDDA